MAKMSDKTSGSDDPQRQNYKKTGKMDPTKKSGFVFDAKSKGKGLNSSSKNIFQMGRKAK